MSSIFLYIIIGISATFSSADISIDVKQCKEQVITRCQCGEGGFLTDVYVDGCQVASNESHPCQPCPGSCQLFFNCKICSKYDCISCPIGKTGPNCDKDEVLQISNDTIPENTQNNLIQNVTESPLLETTISEVSNNKLNRTLPKIIIYDVSRIKMPSFELTTKSNGPEMKLDILEDVEGNYSTVKDIPEEKVLENISTKDNETFLDISVTCTSNCSNNTTKTINNSLVSLIDGHNGNNLYNITDTFEFDDNVDFRNTQSNESMGMSSESGEIAYESQPLSSQDVDDVQEFQYSRVNIPLNVSVDLGNDYASFDENDTNNQLMKHRSPNPSLEEDNAMTGSSNENNDKEDLQYEQDQQVLEISEKDYPEKSLVSDIQETIEDIQKPTGPNLNSSFIEFDSNTAPDTKYVYLSTYDLQDDENESKYPDIVQEESFPSEQDPVDVIKLNKTDDIETAQSEPNQKYDFSKPHLLKQYFDIKEEKNPKPEMNFPDLWKNLCTVLPIAPVCNSHTSTPNDRNTLHPRDDPHAHIEHTLNYFRSPDYPGNKFLFSTANDVPKDVLVDIMKLRSMDNSDTIHTHRPIPQSLNMYNKPTNPLQFSYLNQRYPLNQSPVPPKNDNSPTKFQTDLFPSLFDHLLHLIGPHIPPYQDRSFSGDNREYGSSEFQQDLQVPMKMFQSVNPILQTPGQPRVPQKLFSDYNFKSLSNSNPFKPFNFQDTDSNSIFSDQGRVPVVKGQIIIAEIANENGTAPQIIPGSIRSQNFEFEIPMMMPVSHPHLMYPGNKEYRNSKTEHSKHSKGARRPKKLHKRRRNGVKGDVSRATSKCNPSEEDCPKSHHNNIDSHSSFSGRKMNHNNSFKSFRIDGNTMKFMKKLNGPSYSSTEIISTVKSNEIIGSIPHLKANESIVQSQRENLVNERFATEDEILQASDESNSDSESNQPPRRFRRSESHFCPIPKDNRNGDLDCTIWTYKKKCTLTCHPGYTSPNQHFTCSRSKDTWLPPLTACTGSADFELDDNSIQLKHLEDLPANLADEEEETNEDDHHEEASHEDYDGEHSEEHKVEDHQEAVDHENAVDHEDKADDHEEAVDDEVDEDHKESEAKEAIPKKAHVNSVNMHEESHEETEHTHKSKKSHGKSEKPKHHKSKKIESKEEQPKTEEQPKKDEEDEQEEVPKTSIDSEEEKESSEKHTEEDSLTDEASAEIQEVEHNYAYEDSYESQKKK